MSERQTNSATGRIGIIDLGSNSLRLAVFERHGGVLFPLINEKVMCGLARGLSTSGRLNRDGTALAMVNLRRFVALAHAIGVDHLAVLATAAVRDASDGQVFADEVARECRVPVAIIDGAEDTHKKAWVNDSPAMPFFTSRNRTEKSGSSAAIVAAPVSMLIA